MRPQTPLASLGPDIGRALLLLALAAACPVARADTWNTVRGNPQRTGNIDGISGPKAPKVLWVYKAQEHYVAALVPGPKSIFAAGVGAFGTGVFHAVSTEPEAQERVLWSKGAAFLKRPSVSAAAVMDGLVIFGDGMHQTDDATLYCLRAEDGLPVWQYPLPGKLVHLEAGPTVGAPGTLGQGRVYVCGGDAGVLCVDLNRVLVKDKEQDLNAALANTERRWTELLNKYEQDKQQDATKAIPPTEAALTIPVPKLLWQQGQGKWHIDAPPLVVGDYLLAASAYLDDEKIGKRCLVCLKTTDGSLVWETPLEINPWAGPSVAGRSVLVGCSSIRFDRKLLGGAKGEVVSLDLATGKVRWREAAPGGVLSPVAVKGEAAVFTTTGGQVVARHCGTGRLLWKYEAGRPFFAGPAVAADTVYAADLKNVLHAIRLADGQRQWTLDVAGDQSVQAKGMVFGSPLVHGGDIYLATCNLDADTDDPSVIVCLSDKAAAGSAALPVIVEKERRRISVPCKVAPRKLAWLNAVYPLEVVATYPTPRGQKAHETVVTFECKPSEIHRALESFGLKPGKPARGDDEPATGPELRLYLELPGIGGKPDVVPLEKTMIDKRTGKPLPPLKWCFTGSVGRQIDPEKEDTVYGADLSGTMITIYPVTDETVCQGNLTMRDGSLLALEVNKNLLPEEGAELRLIIEAK